MWVQLSMGADECGFCRVWIRCIWVRLSMGTDEYGSDRLWMRASINWAGCRCSRVWVQPGIGATNVEMAEYECLRVYLWPGINMEEIVTHLY